MPLAPKNDLHMECQTAMGTPLGDLYFLLWQELSWLHYTHSEFEALFATGSDSVEVMNSTAPDFFALVERLLWHDLFLGLCRITDPPRSAGKDNLTIQRLPSLIADRALHVSVESLVSTATNRTAFARDWRNRQIAHRDFKKTIEPTLYPLSKATRFDINESLNAVDAAMNRVELAYLDSTTAFTIIRATHGASELLHQLRRLE